MRGLVNEIALDVYFYCVVVVQNVLKLTPHFESACCSHAMFNLHIDHLTQYPVASFLVAQLSYICMNVSLDEISCSFSLVHHDQSTECLELSLIDIVLEPQSVANVTGASEFILQEAYMELLVGTGVERHCVEQRH